MIIQSPNVVLQGLHGRPFIADITYRLDGHKKPVVIFSHGYVGFKDWGPFNAMAHALAEMGLVVVKFNFSHNGTTVDDPYNFADLEAFGNDNFLIELDDLKVVIDWVCSDDFPAIDDTDALQLSLLGHSRGGGITILKAREDVRVKKLVTWNSVNEFGKFWTPERFEQELFGEEANGKQVRPGLLELADGGTLYLDEIADMPLSTQARILRVLTDQSFVRVGGTRQIGVDVRVVSSTTRDLTVEMAEKRFREDLFYRLNVVPVAIPSLAQRREDIPTLAEHFFTRYSNDQGLVPPDISSEAMAALQAYDWPGNVRQLENALYRAITLLDGYELEKEHLQLPSYNNDFGYLEQDFDGTLDEAVKRFEANLLRKLFPAYPSSRQLAKKLGLSHTAVANKLRDYGINRKTVKI